MNFKLKGSMLGKVAVLVGGTSFAQGLVIAASPVLTRLYSPDDFGLLALYMSIISILCVIASLRYESAIPLPGEDAVAANLLVLSVAIAFLVSVLLGVALWLSADSVLPALNAGSLSPYLWILPVSLFGIGTYNALSFWALRRKAYVPLARTKVNQSFGQLLLQVGLGLLQTGKIGLLAGDAFGRLGGSGTLLTLLWKKDKAVIRSCNWRNMKKAACEYRKFPLVSSGSGLLNSIGLYITPILMTMFYGPEVAGWLLLSQRVIGAPMDLVGQSVGQVYIGEGSQHLRERPEALRHLFFSTAKKLFLIGIAPIAVLTAIGPWGFQLVFGDEWREAGVYVQMLSVMFLSKLVIGPLANTLTMLEKLNWQLGWDTGRFMLVIGGQWAAYAWNLPPLQAIMIYSATMTISYMALFVMAAVALSKHALPARGDSLKIPIPNREGG